MKDPYAKDWRSVRDANHKKMAASRLREIFLVFLYYTCLAQVLANPVNIPLKSVTNVLIQSALRSLNENAPTHHTYADGNLISAQKLVDPRYITYRLTFDLNPICKEAVESCPREACTIDLIQNDLGFVEAQQNSIQCMYLYPQLPQDESVQENVQDASFQDAELVENLDKQIVLNKSVELHHEIQTDSDQNDRPFIAVRASTPNYCPGCPYELNPNLPGLIAFTDKVTKSLDESLSNDYKHKLIQIMKVTRTVPPSSNIVQYQLLLEIGETNCLKNSLVEDSYCIIQNNIPSKTCLVTFEEQPWQQDSRRITRNNCTTAQNVERESYVKLNSESQTAGDYNKGLDQSTVSEAYEGLKDLLIDNVTESSGPSTEISTTENNQPLAKEESFVQVVLSKNDDNQKPAAFVNKTKEFDDFLEGFDVPIRTSSVSSYPDATPVDEEVIKVEKIKPEVKAEIDSYFRKKRSVSNDFNSRNDLVNQLAQKALDTLNEMDSNNKKRILLDVHVDSKRRSKNGFVYYLKLQVKDCYKNEDIRNCLEKTSQGTTRVCKVEMYTSVDESPNTAKVINSVCHDSKKNSRTRRTRRLVGAPTQKNIDDEEIVNFANMALGQFSENSEGTNEPIIVNITEATAQVVSGMLYKIKVNLGTSDCPKGTKNNCQLKADSDIKECLFTVWSQPWLQTGPRITVDCNQNKRQTRSIRGKYYSEKMLKLGEELKQERMFEDFKKKFDRSYRSTKEEKKRFKIFKKNLRLIEELQRNEQGTAEYGVTMFADLTTREYKMFHLGLRTDLKRENEIPFPQAKIPDISLPAEFDWRHYNVVTPVKDQGQCGSCWAFSVTGNIEGQYAIKHKQLLSLSEQELLDCDKLDDGCEGGLPDSAYRAIEKLGGLELETDYPYEAEDDKCQFNKDEVKVKVVSAVNITSNETQMAQWLVQNGPIAVGLNANAMQFYIGGISHPFKFLCSPQDLDHGVLIVGYGVHKYPLFKRVMPYWIIKNSWGKRWGEQGYYRLYRGDGSCGVNTMASSAIVA